MKLVPGKGLDLNQDHIAMMGRKDFKLDPVYVSPSFPNSILPGKGSPVS